MTTKSFVVRGTVDNVVVFYGKPLGSDTIHATLFRPSLLNCEGMRN